MTQSSFLHLVSQNQPESSREADEVKSRQTEWLEAFESDFWRLYPRKVGKHPARLSWNRIKPWNQETCDQIFAGLDRWLKFWLENATDPRYIPYPATWLNQRRWEDEP